MTAREFGEELIKDLPKSKLFTLKEATLMIIINIISTFESLKNTQSVKDLVEEQIKYWKEVKEIVEKA